MTDVNFKFEPTPKDMTVGVADLISTNVYDAGANVKLFEGTSPKPAYLTGMYKITAGTGALSFRVRLWGADAAAGTGNPVILADSGVITLDSDGTALAVGDVIPFAIPVVGQRIAKRYYGVFTTQGTADQDGEYTAIIAEAPQTNLPARKAAVP